MITTKLIDRLYIVAQCFGWFVVCLICSPRLGVPAYKLTLVPLTSAVLSYILSRGVLLAIRYIHGKAAIESALGMARQYVATSTDENLASLKKEFE